MSTRLQTERRAEKVAMRHMINTRISRIMAGDDMALSVLAAMGFEDLQNVVNVVVHHSDPNSEAVARDLFREYMLKLTTLKPWRAPRVLTADEMQWLGSVGVRTEMVFNKKTSDPLALVMAAAKEAAKDEEKYDEEDWDLKIKEAKVLAKTTTWQVNGDSRLEVNANGEFWLAPAGTPIPAQVTVVDAAGAPNLTVESLTPFPILLPVDPVEMSLAEEEDDYMSLDPRDDPKYRLLHRVGGPAMRDSAGFEIWARRGLPHRVDGPAVIRSKMAPGGVEEEREKLYFFRGVQVADQAALTAATAAAAPDPVFDDTVETAAAVLLPHHNSHMQLPAEWLAILANTAPIPLPPPVVLEDLPFSPNATLEWLLQSNWPVRSIEIDDTQHIHVLQLDAVKPLGDAVRDDMRVFFSQPITEVEENAIDNDQLLYRWGYFPATTITGLPMYFECIFTRIVGVELLPNQAVRLSVTPDPNVEEVELPNVDELQPPNIMAL